MSVNYIDKSTGDLIRVAGQGKAEYGASTVRKGTFTGTDNGTGLINITVTFDNPMPDADYLVDITDVSSVENFWVSVAAKTKNGFSLYLRKSTGGSSITVNGTYTAFKLYTDTEYNNLLNNAVLTSDVTNVIENGNMNPVTSNAIYDTLNTSITDLTADETAMTYEDYTVETLGAHMYQVGRLCWVHIDIRVTYTGEVALDTDGHKDFWSNKFSIPDFDDVSEWNAIPCFGYISNSHRRFEITLNNFGITGGQKAIAFRLRYGEDEPIYTGDVFNLRCVCCFAKA